MNSDGAIRWISHHKVLVLGLVLASTIAGLGGAYTSSPDYSLRAAALVIPGQANIATDENQLLYLDQVSQAGAVLATALQADPELAQYVASPSGAAFIPVHNDADALSTLLASLYRANEGDDWEIIVALNGCTDSSRDIAYSYAQSSGVRVIDLQSASKVAALNAADQIATKYPRAYIDADVQVSADTVRALLSWLSSTTHPHVASPKLRIDTTNADWRTRAYYQIVALSPYTTNSRTGSGIYALNRTGRQRFAHFPDLIADDLFVANQFQDSERVELSSCEFQVDAPPNFRALIDRGVRILAGNLEQMTPEHRARRVTPYEKVRTRAAAFARPVVQNPRLWLPFVVYTWAYATMRIRATKALRQGYVAWNSVRHSHSSRVPNNNEDS